jgi:hypothetical protein
MNHSLEARGCFQGTTVKDNQQGYQAASESLQTSDTSVYDTAHVYLEGHLGRYGC